MKPRKKRRRQTIQKKRKMEWRGRKDNKKKEATRSSAKNTSPAFL
jgi:hypothetical protein